MADALGLAEKISQKAADTLSPLELEMTMAKWPAEFRAIVWEAVADMAGRLARDAKNERS